MRASLSIFIFSVLCLLALSPAVAQTSTADTTTIAAETNPPLTRAQRKEQALMDNLHSDRADLRISAYQKLSMRHDTATLNLLSAALAAETDADAREVLLRSRQKIILFVGTPADQYVAIQTIRQLPVGEGMPLMMEYVGQEEVDDGCLIAAKAALRAWEHQQSNVDGIQNLFSGLSLGSILILVALGLSIIYGLARIINMAHGEFMMIGAYTTYCMQLLFQNFMPASWFDAAWFLSLPISFVTAALFGLVIERLVIRHLYSRPLESLLALGVSVSF